MKILPALLIALGAIAPSAHARPIVVQESARITNPDPTGFPYFASDVAIDGDDAIATMERYIPPPDGFDLSDQEHEVAVYLFHLSGNTWTPVKQLVLDHDFPFTSFKAGLAMRNGIAALALNPLYVFERRNGDWVSASVTGTDPTNPGDSVSIDGDRIFFGGSSGPWTGTLYERNASGVWGPTSTMVGDYRGGDIEFSGGPVDISGNRAIVLSPYNDADPMLAAPSVAAFSEWGPPRRFLFQSEIRSSETAPLGYQAAIRGDEIFIAGTNVSGTRVYRPAPSDAWEEFDKLQPLDSYMGGGVAELIQKNHLFIMQRSYNAERDAYVINVFRKDATDDPYEHVATLVASKKGSIGNFTMSGRRVIADCGGEACVFDLPTNLSPPDSIQQTFAGTTLSAWRLSSGSAFKIVRRGVSRVLQQSEAASASTHSAVLDDSDWTNQSIQADVRPLSFGSGGWDGLATRYRDSSNFYYVRVDGNGVVALRRKVSGAITTLKSAQARIILNRPYRLRLESIGTRHRVYFNGAPLLDVEDAKLDSGRAALLTHLSTAEFDNVVVSPTPATIIYARDFTSSGGPTDLWNFTGIGLWQNASFGAERVFSQSSVAGAARAIAGVPTDDQSVDVRARPTTFAGTGDGDRWFGVMARYVDDANYYYLSVRNTNSVSLRKLTDGAITVLSEYSLPVTLGTWYRLRLEAVGTQIRGYVNGTLVGEATDSSLPRGAAGPITNRAAVDFDDYRAIQP